MSLYLYSHYKYTNTSQPELFFLHLPRKMEPIEGSETSAFKPQTQGKYPKENILHKEYGESLKSRHNNSFNITYTITSLHVSALTNHHQALNFNTYCFYSFCLTVFRVFVLGIPFALQTRVTAYLVLGRDVVCICVWCPLLFVFGGVRGVFVFGAQIPTTSLPNTRKAVTLVCNAKGIPNTKTRKTVKQ